MDGYIHGHRSTKPENQSGVTAETGSKVVEKEYGNHIVKNPLCIWETD